MGDIYISSKDGEFTWELRTTADITTPTTVCLFFNNYILFFMVKFINTKFVQKKYYIWKDV